MSDLPRKYDDMETVRGLAALGVVVYHFIHGFVPFTQASAVATSFGVIVERPFLIALINGPFMVSIFFVLSSFVLTHRLVIQPDAKVALAAILKRFPRLLPLTLVGTLFPAALFVLGWMRNDELAMQIDSSWLRLSGGVKIHGEWPEPSLIGALHDSIVLFWRGLSQYNSALWTMKYELVGSIFALVTALLLGANRTVARDCLVILVLGIVGLKYHPLVSVCVATVFVTKYVCRPGFSVSRWASLLLIGGGLLLGSTYQSLPEELLQDEWARTQVLRADWFIHGAGALLILLGVRGWLRSPFHRSRLGLQLGRLSFPMYVLHLPIFASAGSAIILALGYGWIGLLIAFVASMVLVIAASVPVAHLDEWWVRTLNRALRRAAYREGVVPVADPAP